jgi:hypothetical protein
VKSFRAFRRDETVTKPFLVCGDTAQKQSGTIVVTMERRDEKRERASFDTIAVWRAADKEGSEDLRVWLGEVPAKHVLSFPSGKPQPTWRNDGLGNLVTIVKPRAHA